MTLDDLHRHLKTAALSLTHEYTRLFHGRGNTYGSYRFLTIDSADKVLFAVLFEANEEEEEIVSMLCDFYSALGTWEALVVQQRYLPTSPSAVVAGELPEECFAIENTLKYRINFLNAQNIGFFPDMKLGRSFVRAHAKGKKVLNLFSYTCSFSVVAMDAGAQSVVNVDMNKNVLTMGRENHHLNSIETKNVEFMPYNILTQLSHIKPSSFLV